MISLIKLTQTFALELHQNEDTMYKTIFVYFQFRWETQKKDQMTSQGLYDFKYGL